MFSLAEASTVALPEREKKGRKKSKQKRVDALLHNIFNPNARVDRDEYLNRFHPVLTSLACRCFSLQPSLNLEFPKCFVLQSKQSTSVEKKLKKKNFIPTSPLNWHENNIEWNPHWQQYQISQTASSSCWQQHQLFKIMIATFIARVFSGEWKRRRGRWKWRGVREINMKLNRWAFLK